MTDINLNVDSFVDACRERAKSNDLAKKTHFLIKSDGHVVNADSHHGSSLRRLASAVVQCERLIELGKKSPTEKDYSPLKDRLDKMKVIHIGWSKLSQDIFYHISNLSKDSTFTGKVKYLLHKIRNLFYSIFNYELPEVRIKKANEGLLQFIYTLDPEKKANDLFKDQVNEIITGEFQLNGESEKKLEENYNILHKKYENQPEILGKITKAHANWKTKLQLSAKEIKEKVAIEHPPESRTSTFIKDLNRLLADAGQGERLTAPPEGYSGSQEDYLNQSVDAILTIISGRIQALKGSSTPELAKLRELKQQIESLVHTRQEDLS